MSICTPNENDYLRIPCVPLKNNKSKHMKTLFTILFCSIIGLAAIQAKPKKDKTKKVEVVTVVKPAEDTMLFKSKVDTVSYFIGMQIGNDMHKNGIDDINPKLLMNGLADALKDIAPKIDPQIAMVYAQNYFKEKSDAKQAAEAAESKKFLDSITAKPSVKTTASGLRYEIIQDATGPKPSATDNVTVHYTGKLVDGKVFDSSVERGEPVTFPLNGVIKGWTEGVQLMSVGSKYKFYIPGNLAYGEQGVPQAGIGPNATLVFDVELIRVDKPAPQVPSAPSNMIHDEHDGHDH